MIARSITDWNDAYANVPNIPGGDNYADSWTRDAAAFRDRIAASGRFEPSIAYGSGERNTYDLFMPDAAPKGLFVFIHGGYWMRFDPSYFWQLAAGPLARGFAVAMPRYTLCPDTHIRDITAEVGKAVTAAAERIDGPIVLSGHSAGGHLATRMICANTPLDANVHQRIVNTVSISGVHDLRPLVRLELNATLRLDAAEAASESPALMEPLKDKKLVCWVGAGERAEFIRNNALLASIWLGLGATTTCVEEPDRHHFNVIEGLSDPDNALTRAAFDGI